MAEDRARTPHWGCKSMASQPVIRSQCLHPFVFVFVFVFVFGFVFVFVFVVRHCYLHWSRALALNNVVFCQQHVPPCTSLCTSMHLHAPTCTSLHLHIPPCIFMYLHPLCSQPLSLLSSFLPFAAKAQLNACFFACKWLVKSLMLKVRATAFLLPLEGQVIEQVLPSALLGFKVIELEDALLHPD